MQCLLSIMVLGYWYLRAASVHDVLVQDCSNSIANALELLQFCTKPVYITLSSYGDVFYITGSLWGNPPGTSAITHKGPVMLGFDVFPLLSQGTSCWMNSRKTGNLRCHEVHLCHHPNVRLWLVQERRNSIANALEIRLSCTNPSMYGTASRVTPHFPSVQMHEILTIFFTLIDNIVLCIQSTDAHNFDVICSYW